MTAATTSSTSSKGGKKGAKPKKAATGAKGRKGRAKKTETAKAAEVSPDKTESLDTVMEDAPALDAATTESIRGKKRKSEMMAPASVAGSDETSPDGPAPAKRRTTRSRAKPADEAPKASKKASNKKKETKSISSQKTGTPSASPEMTATLSGSPFSQRSNEENQHPARFSALSPLVSTRRSATPLDTSTPTGSVIIHQDARDADSDAYPETTTPVGSPLRQANALVPASAAWTAVDLEAVFLPTPGGDGEDKENAGLGQVMDGVKATLTSPERKMTVEQWIRHDADNGAERLRHQCERMVTLFEKEGLRALHALEAIPVIGH